MRSRAWLLCRSPLLLLLAHTACLLCRGTRIPQIAETEFRVWDLMERIQLVFSLLDKEKKCYSYFALEIHFIRLKLFATLIFRIALPPGLHYSF